MISILALYTTLSSPVALVSAVHARPLADQQIEHAVPLHPADTGATMAAPPGVLTPQELQAYITVNTALTAYWAAHPNRKDTVLNHTTHVQSFEGGGGSISSPRIDYAQLVRQDSAVAALFAHAPLTPARFGAIQATVRQVIWAILQDKTADSTTVTGRNMALVRPQRPALASDWTELQHKQATLNGFVNMIINHEYHADDQQGLAP